MLSSYPMLDFTNQVSSKSRVDWSIPALRWKLFNSLGFWFLFGDLSFLRLLETQWVKKFGILFTYNFPFINIPAEHSFNDGSATISVSIFNMCYKENWPICLSHRFTTCNSWKSAKTKKLTKFINSLIRMFVNHLLRNTTLVI